MYSSATMSQNRIMPYVVEMVWLARITCQLEATSGLPLKAFSQAVLINQRLAAHNIDPGAQPLTSNTCQSAASPLTSFSQAYHQSAACRQHCFSISGLPLAALTQQLSRSQAILVNQRPRRSHQFSHAYNQSAAFRSSIVLFVSM